MQHRLHRHVPVVRAAGQRGRLHQRARAAGSAGPVPRHRRRQLRHRRHLRRRGRVPLLRQGHDLPRDRGRVRCRRGLRGRRRALSDGRIPEGQRLPCHRRELRPRGDLQRHQRRLSARTRSSRRGRCAAKSPASATWRRPAAAPAPPARPTPSRRRRLVCRATAGLCDVAETCSGTAPRLARPTVSSPPAPSAAAVGRCDVPESCTGTTAACPADGFRRAGIVCHAAVPILRRRQRPVRRGGPAARPMWWWPPVPCVAVRRCV